MTRALSMMLSLLLAFSFLSASCGSSGSDPGPGTVLKSDKQRISNPDVSDADALAQAAGNRSFAVDMYRELAREDGNVFFSPYSISLALAMTWAGARNETEAQMASTLHFGLEQERLHPVFNYIDLALNSRGQGASGADGEGFRLHVVNETWGQEGYGFLEEFLDVLAENYGAGMRLMDFIAAPEECRVTINEWVEEQTEGLIEDLIPQGSIDELTRLVLTNAIYFNAAWKSEFPPEATVEEPFHLADGGSVQVPMMSQMAEFPAFFGEGFRALELPYDGDELSMVVVVPDTGFEAFEAGLTIDLLDSVVASLQEEFITVKMPRWTFATPSIRLKQLLSDLGMPVAFSTGADFSGMDGRLFLYIGDVIHKAFVSVDEAGTEAGVATAVIMEGYGMPPEDEIHMDRPFIYLIRDIETDTILFMGRLVDPS